MYFIFEAIASCVLSIGLLHYRVDSALPFRSTSTTKCHRACHPTDANKINIHMIPHTHDDVGWLKTVDQYYYGSNKHNALPGVQYILDSVTSELMKNSDRRFVYVESAYFWAWWDEQDDKTRSLVNQLVDEGRFQFLHGGWCMSDEATPHYSAMIDQMTLGLKFLNDTFGECGRPTAAWQIDPFGHSSEVAIEFAEMGFDGLFVGRIDYDDRRNRKNAETMEMVWKPDPSLGEAGELFTTVFYESYSAPGGFCFDIFCDDDPIMDNKKLHGYNVDDKVMRFESIMKDYSSVYKSRHLAVTFGDDFTYTVASAWFKNMDKLIKYANNRSDFHLLYSTPSCYLEAINAENLTWPVKESDDFFPYASDDHSYWTGYFTSRPTFKGFTYLSNNILQATKQLATLIGEKLSDEEFSFKKAVAIAQHHDGVSGTEKQHVTDDYAMYLDQGLKKGETIITQVYREVYGEEDYPDQSFCTLRNISECGISQDWQSFVVTVYNPLSRTVSYPIKVPVANNFSHRVFLHNGTEVEVDLIQIPDQILNLPGRISNATHDLTFIAKNLPALGVISYYVEANKQEIGPSTDEKETPQNNDTVVLDNGIIKLTFNKTDGMLRSVTKDEVTWSLHQNFYLYNATKGYNYDAASRASGAYIFRPTSTEPQAASSSATITRYRGNNVFEVHQKFTSWISQVVRLYKNVSDIEFEWVVGEIPIVDWTGLEVVSKYLTDIASNKTFYTDSNGRRWMKRIRDYRKYWNLSTSTETVSRNYYPLTSAICLRDSSRQATVLIDRPEGGTSMRDGEIEIMLHRRLMYDDAKGVGEPLDEKAYGKGLVVRGRHTLQLNSLDAADTAHRFKAVESQYAPISTLSKTPFTRDRWIDNYRNKSFSAIAAELPPNVHLLTLERWRKDQVLIRIEHIFQADETPQYARPVNLNIEELFAFFKVKKIQELSLAANWEKNKLRRLKWQSQGSSNKVPVSTRENNITILEPMQIRTFLLDVERK